MRRIQIGLLVLVAVVAAAGFGISRTPSARRYVQALRHFDPWAEVDAHPPAKPAAQHPMAGAVFIASRAVGSVRYGLDSKGADSSNDFTEVGPVALGPYGSETLQVHVIDPGALADILFVVATEEHGTSLWALAKSGANREAPIKLAGFRATIDQQVLAPGGKWALIAVGEKLYRAAVDGSSASAPEEWATLPPKMAVRSMLAWPEESRVIFSGHNGMEGKLLLASADEQGLTDLTLGQPPRIFGRLAPGVILVRGGRNFYAVKVPGGDSVFLSGAENNGAVVAMSPSGKELLYLPEVSDDHQNCRGGEDPYFDYPPYTQEGKMAPPKDFADKEHRPTGVICVDVRKAMLVPAGTQGFQQSLAEDMNQLAVTPDNRHILIWKKDGQLVAFRVDDNAATPVSLGERKELKFLSFEPNKDLLFSYKEASAATPGRGGQTSGTQTRCMHASFTDSSVRPTLSEVQCNPPARNPDPPIVARFAVRETQETALFRLADDGSPIRLTTWEKGKMAARLAGNDHVRWNREKHSDTWSVIRNDLENAKETTQIPDKNDSEPLGFTTDSALFEGTYGEKRELWKHPLEGPPQRTVLGEKSDSANTHFVKEVGLMVVGGFDCVRIEKGICWRGQEKEAQVRILGTNLKDQQVSPAFNGQYLGYSKVLDRGVFFVTAAKRLPAVGSLSLADMKAMPVDMDTIAPATLDGYAKLLADRFAVFQHAEGWTVVPLRPGQPSVEVAVAPKAPTLLALDDHWQAFGTPTFLCVIPTAPAEGREAACTQGRITVTSGNDRVLSVEEGSLRIQPVAGGGAGKFVSWPEHQSVDEMVCQSNTECIVRSRNEIRAVALSDATLSEILSMGAHNGTTNLIENPAGNAFVIDRTRDIDPFTGGVIGPHSSVAWAQTPGGASGPLATKLLRAEDGRATAFVGFARNHVTPRSGQTVKAE